MKNDELRVFVRHNRPLFFPVHVLHTPVFVPVLHLRQIQALWSRILHAICSRGE